LDDFDILFAAKAGKSRRQQTAIRTDQGDAALPANKIRPADAKLAVVQLARIDQFLKTAGGVAGYPDLRHLALGDAEAAPAMATNAALPLDNPKSIGSFRNSCTKALTASANCMAILRLGITSSGPKRGETGFRLRLFPNGWARRRCWPAR